MQLDLVHAAVYDGPCKRASNLQKCTWQIDIVNRWAAPSPKVWLNNFTSEDFCRVLRIRAGQCERTFIASFYNSWDRKNFSNLNWMEIDKGSPKSKGRDDFCLAPFLFEWPVACWTRQGKGRRVRPPHVICVFHLDCNCTFNSLCHLIGRDARMVVLLVENRKSKSLLTS